MQNPRAKGSARDKEILHAIAEYRALDADQVWALYFSRIKHGRRKAQDRLLTLHRRGELQRTRAGAYVYYYERPKQLKHLIGVNWVRIWLGAGLKSWEKLSQYHYEVDYRVLRADAFATVRNTVAGGHRFYFIEMERSHNGFDKVQKYCKLFEREAYKGWWWVKLTNRFPPILVVTTTPGKARHIERVIGEQNTAGLEWRVLLLDDLRREVLDRCK